ncbi:unnamed protein product [Toxocara canis]|uniref:Transmembrane protein 176B n=1 Tax=Toxocara canis TaxID=6265 RepID=A0A183V791_TOXCA|nr:unnamed protein product [Toxocara canis]
MDLLRTLEDPALRLVHKAASQLSSETDEEPLVEEGRSQRRRYKAYTVMQKSGFQHTEVHGCLKEKCYCRYVSIMVNLCRVEIVISLGFLVHGISCPGYAQETEYQSACHMNVVAAVVGTFTGAVGLGVVHRYRWRMMLVMWLVLSIISAVGNLLSVITAGIWLDHLSKMKTRTGIVNGLSGMMLLASVAVDSIANLWYTQRIQLDLLAGVCYILTSVLVCHFWVSNSPKYQAVGKISKRPRSVRRRASRPSSGTEWKSKSDKHSRGYNVV